MANNWVPCTGYPCEGPWFPRRTAVHCLRCSRPESSTRCIPRLSHCSHALTKKRLRGSACALAICGPRGALDSTMCSSPWPPWPQSLRVQYHDPTAYYFRGLWHLVQTARVSLLEKALSHRSCQVKEQRNCSVRGVDGCREKVCLPRQSGPRA